MFCLLAGLIKMTGRPVVNAMQTYSKQIVELMQLKGKTLPDKKYFV